jgi:hypothetical protein
VDRDVFEFDRFTRAARGYRWVTGRNGEDGSAGRFLIPVVERDSAFAAFGPEIVTERGVEDFFDELRFIEEPDAVRGESADDRAERVRKPFERTFLRIADTYGLLGVYRSHFHSPETSQTYGESFLSWDRNVGKLRQAFWMWDDLRHNPSTALARELAITINENLSPDEPPSHGGHCYVAGCDSPLYSLNHSAARYSLTYDPAANLFTGKVLGSGPLASAWLALAQAVCGERTIIECEVCHNLMDVTRDKRPNARRMHEQCSNRKRMREYRSRKK